MSGREINGSKPTEVIPLYTIFVRDEAWVQEAMRLVADLQNKTAWREIAHPGEELKVARLAMDEAKAALERHLRGQL